MPTEDPKKVDVSEQQASTTEKAEAPELSEDELKAVSGGMLSIPTDGGGTNCIL